MAATSYFNKFKSYSKMVVHAKSLAKQSVLIDHCGIEHIDLKSNFKNIDRVYSVEKETKRGFTKLSLIEFKTRKDAENVVRLAPHNEGLLPVPLKILRYNGKTSSHADNQNLPFPVESVRLSIDRELSPNFNTYTELISNNMMSLMSLKLRFVTLVNFEKILCSGMFEEYQLMPFGSSVIDMGCESGDLDLVITRQRNHYEAITRADKAHHQPGENSHLDHQAFSQLVHLDKSLYCETKDNNGFRGTMRWFDHILKEYMPLTDGFGVLCLHRAKVPIIKFTSRVTNIECDLSFDLGLDHRDHESSLNVNPGILMTEILYSLCRNNNLITALVIYLRIFAKLNMITSKMPGIGLTNFQFLSLIIFFLQKFTIVPASQKRSSPDYQSNDSFVVVPAAQASEYKPLIPSFRSMLSSSYFLKENDSIHFDDHQLNQVLPLLIMRFFDFYSNFDFANSSLNLYESKRERKLDNSTMYVLNPIETNRNICHNVNRKGLETLVKQVRIASSSIRSQREGSSCPLALVKSLMIKHHKQLKKGRTLMLDNINETDPLTADDIAQDACR